MSKLSPEQVASIDLFGVRKSRVEMWGDRGKEAVEKFGEELERNRKSIFEMLHKAVHKGEVSEEVQTIVSCIRVLSYKDEVKFQSWLKELGLNENDGEVLRLAVGALETRSDLPRAVDELSQLFEMDEDHLGVPDAFMGIMELVSGVKLKWEHEEHKERSEVDRTIRRLSERQEVLIAMSLFLLATCRMRGLLNGEWWRGVDG